jgi:hypothetical protein
MNAQWLQWIQANYPQLKDGKFLQTPWWLSHPSISGFARTDLAENVGQKADWVVSVNDGSRIHLHEYQDGRIVIHRDATDPSRGPMHALWHWLTEAQLGKFVLVVGGLLSLSAVGLSSPDRR